MYIFELIRKSDISFINSPVVQTERAAHYFQPKDYRIAHSSQVPFP